MRNLKMLLKSRNINYNTASKVCGCRRDIFYLMINNYIPFKLKYVCRLAEYLNMDSKTLYDVFGIKFIVKHKKI